MSSCNGGYSFLAIGSSKHMLLARLVLGAEVCSVWMSKHIPMKAFDGTSMDVMSSWLRGDISVSVVVLVVVESVSGLGAIPFSLLKLLSLLMWRLNCCLHVRSSLGILWRRRPDAPS